MQFGRDLRDIAGAVAIDPQRDIGLAFGLVHGGIGGGVDDRVAMGGAQRRQNRLAHREVEARTAQSDQFDIGRRPLDQRAHDLARQSGDNDSHAAHGENLPESCANFAIARMSARRGR